MKDSSGASLCFTAFIFWAAGCNASHQTPPVQPRVAETAPASTAPSEVDFSKEDLEEIRAAAIRYYQEKKPEMWEAFVQELRRGAIFLKGDLPGVDRTSIGIWRIEQEDGIALVRWSVDSIALYHGLELARQDGRWIVKGHFSREEFLVPQPGDP